MKKHWENLYAILGVDFLQLNCKKVLDIYSKTKFLFVKLEVSLILTIFVKKITYSYVTYHSYKLSFKSMC